MIVSEAACKPDMEFRIRIDIFLFMLSCIKANNMYRLLLTKSYLKLALCKSLPPRAAGTLPDRELLLRLLHNDNLG